MCVAAGSCTKISAILDALPNRFQRSDLENKTYKMAVSMMKSGIAICKSIDPNNKMIAHFESRL